MYNLDLEKAEEPESELSTFLDHEEREGISERHLLLLH